MYAHNFLLVIGDFNSRVGLDKAPYSYHDHTNRNGEQLLDYALENNLIISNTTFQKKSTKLWTCELPRGHKAQLDYILIRRKWKNSILDVEARNSFSSIESDHRIVTAKIRLSLRAKTDTVQKKIRDDWNKIKLDTELQERYTVDIRNNMPCCP